MNFNSLCLSEQTCRCDLFILEQDLTEKYYVKGKFDSCGNKYCCRRISRELENKLNPSIHRIL